MISASLYRLARDDFRARHPDMGFTPLRQTEAVAFQRDAAREAKWERWLYTSHYYPERHDVEDLGYDPESALGSLLASRLRTLYAERGPVKSADYVEIQREAIISTVYPLTRESI